MQVFQINGRKYAVDVVQLKREFSIPQTNNSGMTMDGAMYREPVGTYYSYTMTVRAKPERPEELDSFWKAISWPDASLSCTFPYNQEMLTQEMYVTGGEQALVRVGEKGMTWGEITVRFVAMRPTVSR